MRKKDLCPGGLSAGLWALLWVIFAGACDLPSGPDYGKGTLTLILPETRVQGTAVPVQAGSSRSVLSDGFTGALVYRLTVTRSNGESVYLEAGGGGTTLSLEAGDWTIQVLAYTPGPAALAGSGSAAITVAAGRNISVRIPMKIDPAYEAGLGDIYIHTEAELRRIGTDFAIDGSINFYLERDIVLTQPWTPVGNDSTPFKAVFDGQGHTITINSFGGPEFPVKELGGSVVYQGFFASVDGAQIKDTTIAYNLADPVVDIRTGDGLTYSGCYAGGVAGFAASTSFENIRVTGNFSIIADGNSDLDVGGIAGQVGFGVTIADCHVTGNIGGTSANYLTIGGIAGMIYSPITGSSFTGAINGSAPSGNCDTGGIAGYAGSNSEITNCFTEGYIKAEADNPRVGGIAGWGSVIRKSYAAGLIESISSGTHSYSGGIAANLGDTIENCYALADVSSSASYGETAGGIAGTNAGTISNCYAAGTVKSKGHDPYTHIGGIMGESGGGAVISACMALVSELDGGPSASTSKNVYAICADTSYSTLTNNYSVAGFTRVRFTNAVDYALNGGDGWSTPLADFESSARYTGASWNFAAGTGDWKFIAGYDYPVLSWQTRPPEFN